MSEGYPQHSATIRGLPRRSPLRATADAADRGQMNTSWLLGERDAERPLDRGEVHQHQG
jgi:hypothetical protein